MATLSKCLGIHAAPPQIQKLVRQKMKEYQQDGYDSQTAVERSLLDVQAEMQRGRDSVVEQMKPAETQPETPYPERLDAALNSIKNTTMEDVDFSIQPPIEGIGKTGREPKAEAYLKRLVAAADNLISVDEAAQIVGTVEQRYAYLGKRTEAQADILQEFQRMGIDAYIKAKPEDWVNMTEAERKWELTRAALLDSLTAKKETLRRSRMSAQALQNMQTVMQKMREENPDRNDVETYIDLYFGNPDGKSNNYAWANRAAGIHHGYMKEMQSAIKEFDSWLGLKMTPEQELALAKEMFKPGSSGDANMKNAAASIRKTFDGMRERMNKNGAGIGYIDGYMTQSWNSRQVMLFGLSKADVIKGLKGAEFQAAALAKSKQAWVEFMLPRLDRNNPLYVDSSLGTPYTDSQMRDFLGKAFDTLSTNGATKDSAGQIKGQSSLAQRLSAERQLFFKDAESWLEANREFGAQDLLTGVISHVERGSKDIALLEMFGPNPERVHTQLLNDAVKANVGKTWFAKSKVNFAEALWMEVSGSRPTAGTGLLADAMAATRQQLVFTRLGAALISQLGDLPIYHAMAQKIGIGALSADFELLRSFNPLNKADRQTADILGVSVTAFHDDVMARIMDTTNGKGLTAKLAQFTMRAGGMKWWADRMTHGAKMGLLRGLGQMQTKRFNSLDSKQQALLKRSGITAEEWDSNVYRAADVLVDFNGRDVLAPDLVKDVGLREKLWGLVEREATFMALRPDEKTRALLKGTHARGSGMGELLNSMSLFRSFTAAMVQKVYPRLTARLPGESNFSRIGMAAQFLLFSTMMAAMSTQLKELDKGRNGRDMTDWRFWAQSFGQAWNIGMLGDLLWGERNRAGGGEVETIAGPVVAALADAFGYTAGNVREVAQGKKTDFAAAQHR